MMLASVGSLQRSCAACSVRAQLAAFVRAAECHMPHSACRTPPRRAKRHTFSPRASTEGVGERRSAGDEFDSYLVFSCEGAGAGAEGAGEGAATRVLRVGGYERAPAAVPPPPLVLSGHAASLTPY
jgi:hypothetical protein